MNSSTKIELAPVGKADTIGGLTEERRQVLQLPITWKLEGGTDCMSFASCIADMMPISNHDFFTTPYGAKDNPLGVDCYGQSKEWLVEQFEGRYGIIIHDCDIPGQEGALWVTKPNGDRRPGWAVAAAKYAIECRNVVLPYPIEETHGKDLRDFVIERNRYYASLGADEYQQFNETFWDIWNYAVSNPDFIISPPTEDQIVVVGEDENGNAALMIEDVADPHRLAQVNLDHYRSTRGREIVHWRGAWYRWRNGRYEVTSSEFMEARINGAIKREFDAVWADEYQQYEQWKASDEYDPDRDKGPPIVRKVTVGLTRGVMLATKSKCQISDEFEMPSWLDDGSSPSLVAVNNGIVDLELLVDATPDEYTPEELADQLLCPHNHKWFSTQIIPYDYTPSAYAPLWERFLETSLEGDQERIALLQEFAGYLLTPINDLQKFLVLEGEGGNGKTVFFAGIEALLGAQNVSHIPIESFDSKFDLGMTLGKAANIAGDVGELDQVAEGKLKQFTGGDTMFFDRKGISGLNTRPTAKLLCAWNRRPRITDRSSGVWRRIILVPFMRQIPQHEKIVGMDNWRWWYKQGQCPGILNWALAGLRRLRDQGHFTRSSIVEAVHEEYRIESNPAEVFLNDFLETSDDPEKFVLSHEIYQAYRFWCQSQGIYPLGNAQFFREFNKNFPNSERKRTRLPGRPWVYTQMRFTVDEIFGEKIEKMKEIE